MLLFEVLLPANLGMVELAKIQIDMITTRIVLTLGFACDGTSSLNSGIRYFGMSQCLDFLFFLFGQLFGAVREFLGQFIAVLQNRGG